MSNTQNTTAVLWGRILALLEAATPGGLDDATRAACLARPAEHLPGLMAGATAKTERIEQLLTQAMARLDAVPDALDAPAQSQAILAGYKERAQLARPPVQYRPAKASWEDVDWSLRNADIARQLGVLPSTVSRQRQKRGK